VTYFVFRTGLGAVCLLAGLEKGLGFDDRREPRGADQHGGLTDEGSAVAEGGAEADVRSRHGRSTVTALYSTVRPAGFTCGLRMRRRSDSPPAGA